MRPPRLLPVLAACGDDDTSGSADSVAVQAEPEPEAGSVDATDGGASADAADGEPAADAGSESAAEPAGAPAEPADDSAMTDDASSTDDGSVAADESGGDGAAVQGDAPAAIRSTRLDDGRIDLLGPDVDAGADVESNPLPSVVVDDIQTGEKVNFRNVAPQNLPILLWMWAPH